MAKLLSNTRVYGTATVDTQLFVNGVTSVHSTNSGALQVGGGIGVAGGGFFAGTVTATNFVGSVSGASASLNGGTAGQIPYQVSPGVTSFFGPGAVGELLVGNGTSIPLFASTTTIYVGNAVTATNVRGGAANQFIYQTAPGVTAFINTGSMYVGNAVTATNVRGGNTGEFIYQSAPGVTSFANTSSMYVGNAVTATNVRGGNAGEFVFQTAPGVSSFATTSSMYVGRAVIADSVAGGTGFVNTVQQTANAAYYLTFVDSNNASATAESVFTTSSFVVNPGTRNVGIGTAAPVTNLHVSSAGSAKIRISADTDDVTETDIGALEITQDGGVTTAIFGLDSSNNLIIGANSTTSPNIYLSTRSDGTSFVSSTDADVTILNNGNVGVGVSPSYKLDVDGVVQGRQGLRSGLGYNSYISDRLQFAASTGFSHHQFKQVDPGSGTTRLDLRRYTGSGDGFDTGEMVTFLNNGNVGIGTTSPARKLQVAGDITINTVYKDFQSYTGTSNNLMRTWDGVLVAGSDNVGAETYTIIETTVPQDSYMMGGFTIDWFENYASTNAKTSIQLGGYWNPESNGGFIGWEYTSTNPNIVPTIQVGRKSSNGNTVIILSHFNASYPIVVARDLWLGYSTGAETYGTGWAILQTSSLTGYTNLDPVVARNAQAAGAVSGTVNYVAKFTSSSAIGNSQIFDNGTNVGVGFALPQKKLDVAGSGIVGSFGTTLSVGGFAGIHFGYSESTLGNDSYKKSALVFERTDAYSGQGGNAGGKIHFLLNNAGSASVSALTESVMTIDSDSSGTVGSVRLGIGTRNPVYRLSVIHASDVWHAQFGTSSGRQIRIGGSTTNGGVIGAYNDDTNGSPAGLFLQRDGGNLGIATTDFSYTASDNTALVGSFTNNRVFVNGSLQLLGNNDAIVFGRGTSSFLKDEELGFGWGSGLFMTDGSFLRVRNGATIQLYTPGTIRADSDVRAPIFYDQNNTAFYTDPASTGNINRELINYNSAASLANGTFNVAATTLGGIHFTNGAGTSGAGNEAAITFQGGTSSQAQAGIYVHNNNSDGTHMAFATTDSYATGPQIGLRIANTGYSLFPRSYAEASGSFRAPIFYDSNDTNYYGDFASTSRFNTLQFASGSTGGPYFYYGNNSRNLYFRGADSTDVGMSFFDSAGSWRVQIYGSSGNYGFLNGNWASWDIRKVPSGELYLNNQSTYYINGSEIFYNRVYGTTDIRSPIYYDYNDTAFYVDPNSTSRIRKTNLVASGSSWDDGLNLYSADQSNRWNFLVDDAAGDIFRIAYNTNERIRVDLSGNFYVFTGNIYGNVFVDNNAYDWYLDPNGYSRLSRIMLDQARVNNSRYPVGHYATGDTVFEIDPTWTNDQLQAYFNSGNVSWVADSTAPGGYAIQVSGSVNVGGDYGSGFPYIPVDQDDIFYMEVWIKSVSGSNGHYMGSIDYNASFGSLGGNPGSFGYWVMSNSFPGTGWTKYSGYITGFGTSTGQFRSGTEYFTPQALFNYSGSGVSYISGWKCIKVSHQGNRTITGRSGSITDNSTYALDIYHPTNYRQLRIRAASEPLIKFSGAYNSGNGGELWQNSGGTFHCNINGSSTAWASVPGPYTVIYGSARSPIFYDQDNTGYYVDPNSTSNVYAMVAYSLQGNGNVGGTGSASWHPSGIYSAGYNWLYGGINGGAGSATNFSDVRANIFYDYNNTGYYLDPTSITSLRTVGSWRSDSSTWDGEFAGKIQYHSNHWYFQSGNLWLFRNAGGSNVVTFDQSGNLTASGFVRAGTNVYTDANYGYGLVGVYTSVRYQGVFAMGDAYKLPADGTSTGNLYGIAWSHPNTGGAASNLASHGMLILENGSFQGAWGGGRLVTPSDIRGTLFYDYNNTGYYADPASTCRFNSVVSNIYDSAYAGGNSGLVRSSYPYTFGFQENGGWSFPYPDMVFQYHTGMKFAANSSYEGMRFYADYNSDSLVFQVNGSSGYLFKYNWLYTNTTGIYSDSYGAHIYPNNGSSYTQWRIDGQKNGYGGIWDSYSAVAGMMYDGAGNGGVYREANGRWYWYYLVGNNCMGIGSSATSSSYRLYINDNGFIANMYANGFYYASDRKLKDNIETISGALETVEKLRGVTYTLKADEEKKTYVGVIAQEIEEVFPSLINKTKTHEDVEYLSVNYGNLAGLFIEAFKEQNAIINNLKEEIRALKEKIGDK